MAELPFGDWKPDLPANKNPGAILAKNCIPKALSYQEFRSLSAFTNGLDSACVGQFWARNSSETVFNFAGDADKLYLLSGGTTWNDVSQTAVTYSADFWDFIVFQDRVIATDGGGTDLQYFDMGTSTEFADLPGSPPRFKALALVRDFIVGGNWSFGGDTEVGGLAWSGFNNSALWTPSLSTQSDRRPARGSGGQVQRIVPGAQGIVVREGSIVLLDYVGPPTVFKADEVIVNHGTKAPRGVTWTRDFVFYYSDEGFIQLNRNNLALTPIGVGLIDQWFRDEAALSDIVNMVGTVDRLRNRVYWAFRSSTSSTNYDRVLVYNWAFKRWAYAEIEVQFIGEFSSVGANLDTLDAVLGSGGIDINSIPVDTDAYIGGALSLLGFTSDNEAATFNGPALVAEFDTTEIGLENARTYVNGIRPIVDGSPTLIEAAPITRALITANPSVGTFTAMNDIGQIDARVSTRYLRYRVRITGGFTHAQRIEFEFKKRGRR